VAEMDILKVCLEHIMTFFHNSICRWFRCIFKGLFPD